MHSQAEEFVEIPSLNLEGATQENPGRRHGEPLWLVQFQCFCALDGKAEPCHRHPGETPEGENLPKPPNTPNFESSDKHLSTLRP